MMNKKPVSDFIVSLIQERSSGLRIAEGFGSNEDIEQPGYEALLPSYAKAAPLELFPTVKIGNSQCGQPYQASVFNASALSFGPLSKPFIIAVNQAAFEAGFYQNTGEAGISPYHYGMNADVEALDFSMSDFMQTVIEEDRQNRLKAGDVVWQIGNGYFGCRDENGNFDAEQFRLKASIGNVKMIEIKLSQGVEPQKEMPVKFFSQGMAKIMGIEQDTKPSLQLQHSHFSTPVELMCFVAELRQLSNGKPIGIKLGLTHKHWFLSLCKAIRSTGICPDFFTVDGMEAGTTASSKCASGYTGTPLNESIVFVHNALVGTNLREQIKIIASGKIFTERDIISKLARGADLCATARGMLIAAGCDQQRECHLGTCQNGIATQDPALTKCFDIQERKKQIVNYHKITVQELNELLGIAGLSHPSEIGPGYIQHRLSPFESRTLDELYEFILPGSLLTPFPWRVPSSFKHSWQLANPDAPFSEVLDTFSLHRGQRLLGSHRH